MRQLIRDALIVVGDGETEPFPGDVLIENGFISHLGSVPAELAADADTAIDARGRVLAPGFVDTHNHGALGGARLGPNGIPIACEMALRGGVTKRICGVDGLSPAPVLPAQREDYAAQLKPLDGAIEGPWTWSSLSEFQDWHRGRSVTDVGFYLGHSAVRRVVMDNLVRVAGGAELADMAALVRREAPFALGLSTGLIYNPAVYCDQRELTELVRAFNEVKPGGLFPHLRSESDNIVASLREVVEAAIDGGGAYCNEHSKIAGPRNYDKIGAIEDMLADAAGVISTMENMYPYTAGSTTGDVVFPPEMRKGSRAEFLTRLADPTARQAMYQRIRGDTTSWDNFIDFCGGLDGVQIAGVKAGVGDGFLGKRLGDVARARRQADVSSFGAFDAVCDFFIDNTGEVSIITHYGNEATMERFFRRPSMAICTDGLMPGPGQKPHPRCIGAFPKALRLARDMGIPLKQMIWRLATLPCRFLNLPDPVLRPGADASLTLFDFATVGERNDYMNPEVSPVGIDAVWVHGERVFDHGRFHVPNPMPGRTLLSSSHI